MTTHHPGYSDRISHALAFAAKHAARTRRPRAMSYLGTPANVAVVLARYGCDEVTIVSGVLAVLVNDADPGHEEELNRRIEAKFGDLVTKVVRQVVQPRFDGWGKVRRWEAYRMDFLANLALAEPRALDVCAGTEIHECGSLLTDLRRLGVEYLSASAPAGADEVLWWYRQLVGTLERHPVGPRPGMLAELRDLTSRLAAELEA